MREVSVEEEYAWERKNKKNIKEVTFSVLLLFLCYTPLIRSHFTTWTYHKHRIWLLCQIFTSSTNPELALRIWNALNFIEKIILETKLTREEYKVKLIALLAFKVLGHYIFFFMMASRLKIWEVGLGFLSLYQDVTHGFDVLVSIIWRVHCLISTRVGIIM